MKQLDIVNISTWSEWPTYEECGIGTFSVALQRASKSIDDQHWFSLPVSLGKQHIQKRSGCILPPFCRHDFNPSIILSALEKLKRQYVLVIQHTNSIWVDPNKFIELLKFMYNEDVEIIVTLHSLHFQSYEKRNEAKLIARIIPHVKAITVFSDGVYDAVIKLNPLYKDKITVIRHGVYSYNLLMSREEARKKLFDYIRQSDIGEEKKKEVDLLADQEDIKIIISCGFLNPIRSIIYKVRKNVENELKKDGKLKSKIIAMHIGIAHPDDPIKTRKDAIYKMFEGYHDGEKNFFINTYLSEEIFPIAFKAGDISLVYDGKWVTQSGRTATGLGISDVLLVGSDFEGEGETFKMIGMPAARTIQDVANIIKGYFSNPLIHKKITSNIARYRNTFSWEKQVEKYFKLAGSDKVPLLDTGLSKDIFKIFHL